MTRLTEWLENPKREYASGVSLFRELAKKEFRDKYLGYFESVENPNPFDMQFTMLVNKLSDISRKMAIAPHLFVQSAAKQIHEVSQVAVELRTISADDLPKGLKKLHDRVREITPLIASLHADVSAENISDETRKEITEQLCTLDDERRANWDIIDDWREGRNVVIESPEQSPFDADNPLLAGMQVANRVKRLRENISRSEKAIEAAEKQGKKNVKANAENRLTAYRDELIKLEQLASDAGKV